MLFPAKCTFYKLDGARVNNPRANPTYRNPPPALYPCLPRNVHCNVNLSLRFDINLFMWKPAWFRCILKSRPQKKEKKFNYMPHTAGTLLVLGVLTWHHLFVKKVIQGKSRNKKESSNFPSTKIKSTWICRIWDISI